MKRTFTFTVSYRMSEQAEVKTIEIKARDKWQAYDLATYEEIPKIEGRCPYSSWVEGVTYKNGTYRQIAKGESMWI